jgi:hypothetical protein
LLVAGYLYELILKIGRIGTQMPLRISAISNEQPATSGQRPATSNKQPATRRKE